MHYTTRIKEAHRTLANRSSLLAGFIDEWPLGKKEEEADTQDPGLTEIAQVAHEAEDEIADLQHTLDFAAEDEADKDAIRSIIVSLRQRIGRLNIVAEILSEAEAETVMEAMMEMYEEKLRIERYCTWHSREKGENPLRSSEPVRRKFGVPHDQKTRKFDPPA